MTVTGKHILQAVIDDGGFDPSMPPAARQILEQFLENDVPTALAALLNQPATAKLITEAQLAYNECYLNQDMPRKLITAGLPNDPRASQVIAAFEGKISQVVQMLRVVVNNFDDMLKQNGWNERDYLLTLNLPTGMTQTILNHQLTIGELVVDCPQVILGFGS